MTASVTRDQPISWSGTIRHYDTQELLTSGVVKATPAVFYEINGYNSSGSLRYIHIYNSATVPTDGAVPACVPIAVPPAGVFSLSFAHGFHCTTGLSWASSTSRDTKTLTGAADVWATITYR